MRLRLLLVTLVLSIVLASLHLYALAHFWYWHYRWFDTPMHLLGGAIVGLFTISIFRSYRPLVYLGIVLGVAFGWEIFEYVFHISTGQADYVFDTTHDILNDFLGAFLVYIGARYTIWRSN